MKVRRALELAVQWCGGDEASAREIFLKQAALDPALREQFEREAREYYVENRLIPEALARGYSLDQEEELIDAIVRRLEKGSW
jgi:hypothetical protein